MTTCTVEYFKMPHATNHFNAGQKVFVLFTTGALACKVVGKYRGRNRYVKAWVRWEKRAAVPPFFKQMEVDAEFARRLGIYVPEPPKG